MSFSICGFTVEAGEKKQIQIVPDTLPEYRMPATILCGTKPGKTLILTASIHSGEYPGVPALIRLANLLNPEELAGNLLIIPCVNVSGFWARSASIVPEDRGNLNQDYPGSPTGGVTARIADYFVREILSNGDFILDLHSGDQQEPLSACLFFTKWEAVREQQLSVAMQLDIPNLIESSASTGEVSYAAKHLGIPGLLLERGSCGYCHEEWIEAYSKDLRQFLRAMGAYPFQEEPVCRKTVYTENVYLTSDRQGLWYPAIREGERIQEGQKLGTIEDFYGNPLVTYYAKGNGIVHYYTCGLSVMPGSPLVAYSLDSGKREL